MKLIYGIKEIIISMYENIDLGPAFSMGVNVAKVLNVKLLGATIANEHKWLKME